MTAVSYSPLPNLPTNPMWTTIEEMLSLQGFTETNFQNLSIVQVTNLFLLVVPYIAFLSILHLFLLQI